MPESPVPQAFVFGAEGVAAVSSRLDFLGLYRDRSALPGLDPLIDRVTQQVGQFNPAPATGPGPVPVSALTGGPAAFFGGLNLPRVRSFAQFVRDYAEQVRVARGVSLPGVGTGVLAQFLPEAFADRGGLSLFGRIGHLFRRGGFRDPISEVEVGFLGTLFLLTRLDWDDIDTWGGRDANLQQLTAYFVELFHGRFRDRNGQRLGFEAGGRFDAADLSPASAGTMFRVFIEYLGDKLFGVPVGLSGGLELKAFTCAKAGLIGTAISGVKLNGTGEDDYSALVSAVVGYAARRAEKTVRATVGGLVRGGGIAAINNEVAAESVSAAAASLAKKASERLTFGILVGYITDPAVGGSAELKKTVLAQLRYLHEDVALPAGVV